MSRQGVPKPKRNMVLRLSIWWGYTTRFGSVKLHKSVTNVSLNSTCAETCTKRPAALFTISTDTLVPVRKIRLCYGNYMYITYDYIHVHFRKWCPDGLMSLLSLKKSESTYTLLAFIQPKKKKKKENGFLT